MMEVTECSVVPIKNRGQEDSPLVAFARICLNGELVINSIKIVHGKFGLFISWPREYNKKEGKGYNLAFPCTKELQDAVTKRVLEEYHLIIPEASGSKVGA